MGTPPGKILRIITEDIAQKPEYLLLLLFLDKIDLIIFDLIKHRSELDSRIA